MSTGDGSHEKMEDQVFTWSSISTRKKTLRSGISTTTKSAILAVYILEFTWRNLYNYSGQKGPHSLGDEY